MKLPKIKRENLVITGLVFIALAIPLTVVLAGARQELRKRAAPTTGSILINGGAATTSTRDVTLTLTAPTHQAFLNSDRFTPVSTVLAATTCQEECEQEGYDKGYGPYKASDGCPAGYGLTPIDVGYSQVCCCSGGGATPTPKPTATPTPKPTSGPIPTPTSAQECKFNPWQNQGCGYPCPETRMYQTRTATSDSPDWCNDGFLYPVENCVVDPACDQTPTPTPTPFCSCTSWKDVQCGGWVCSDDAMHQHRECSPAGCDTENRCPWDQRCAGQEPTPTPAGPTPTPIPLVTNVMISNNSNFSDAQTKSWPFSASSWTIPWTLIKGDGPKIVYAKFQWSDGTETSKVSDDIVLNSKLEPTPTPTPSGSCEDTDGGKEDYGTKGCVTDFGDTRCDSCIDKNTLLELYCEQAPGQDRPCRAGSQVSCPGGTVCEDGACVVPGAPTPTPTVTPVPTPGAKPRAGMGMTPTSGASDKLIVMCHPWQLTYALVGVQAWGHCSEPSETFLFAFTIDYFQGTYYSGPLVAQGAGQHATGVGYWSFFMNDINQMFHFPQRCCRGYAGDIAESFEYTLSAHGACAARNPVTGKLERTSDWSPSVSSSFTVYKKDKYGHVTCDPTEAGDIEVAKPEILDLSHTITGDGGHEGYANVNVTYNTDIESDCKTYLYKWTGMGYDEVHHSGLTTGKSHSYSTSRFYNVEDTGYYRYQAVCAKEGYYSLPDDEDHSDVRTYEEGFFTLPQGGGSPNASRVPLDASDVDLNENEDVDIGDWGALVDDYAKEEEGLPADFNNNGQVDILDVSKFIDAYRRYTN